MKRKDIIALFVGSFLGSMIGEIIVGIIRFM